MSFGKPFWFMPCVEWDHPRRAIAMSWICGFKAGIGFDRCFNRETAGALVAAPPKGQLWHRDVALAKIRLKTTCIKEKDKMGNYY